MRFTSPATMRVVKKEEKEARLRDHIAAHIAETVADRAAGAGHVYRLLVRSHESPVVRALALVGGELAEAGIRIQAVVALPGSDRTLGWPDELAAISECRTVRDMRLLDAHEQLWLGEDTAWIGDCMRREPAKRDAFESYAAGCRETAANARRCFDHFWGKAAVVATGKARARSEAISTALETAVAALQTAEQTPPIASTRH